MTEESKMNVEVKIGKEINENYRKIKDFDDNEYNKFLISISEMKRNDDIKEKKDLFKSKYDIITTDSISTTTDEISNTYQIENKGEEKERFSIHEEKNDSSITNITEENVKKMEENINLNNEYVSVNNTIYKSNIQELNSYQDNNSNLLHNNENSNIQNFINHENGMNRKKENFDNLDCLKKKLNNINSKNEYREGYYNMNADIHNKKNENAIESTHKNENCINKNVYSSNINSKYISDNISHINKNNNVIKYNLNSNNLNNFNRGYNANINVKNNIIHDSKINDKSTNIINYIHRNNKNMNDIINMKSISYISNFTQFTNNENDKIIRINNKNETVNNLKNINNIKSINSLSNLNSVNHLNNLNNVNNSMYYLNLKSNTNIENSKIRNSASLSKCTLEIPHKNIKNSQLTQDNISYTRKIEDKLKFMKNISVDKNNSDIKDSLTCIMQMKNVDDTNKNNNLLKNTSILNNILIDKLKDTDNNKSNKNQAITKKELIYLKDHKNNNDLYSSSASFNNMNDNKIAIKKILKKKKDLNGISYKKINDENYKMIKNLLQNKNMINHKFINSLPKYDLKKNFTLNNNYIEREHKELLHLEQNTEMQKIINSKKKIILTKFELKTFLLNTIKALGIVLKKWKLKKFGVYFWFHIKCIESEIELGFYINIFNFLFEIITGKNIYYQSNDINYIVRLFKEFIIYDCKNIFKKCIKILNRYAKKNSKEFSIFENNEDIIKLNKSLLLNEDELNNNNKKNNFYDFLFNRIKETNDFFEKNGEENIHLCNIFSNFNELNYNEIFNFYLFYNNELNKSYNLHNDHS
ncbi:conserved Plasmodium protein, unknown function [Plasmodium relictum]|uniref:Uncharacterized protein n=1 Tax=Plasmodium relictum TaxID=85471 RepID=A0A1J1H220_PLARL|nr:conserved Plasmodium protein, unknown function [Plasmodium relictum]CRG98806.1 conserved Plasmodium protein, unknown function [Plasmodium relictum]